MANGNNNPLTVSSAVWREIKGLYEGTVPEVAGSRDCNAMRVPVLALRFNLHPNTIFARVRTAKWSRPAWYSQKGSSHPKGERYRLNGQAGEALLKAIADSDGKPCPTNEDLATNLDTSSGFIVMALRRLHGNKRIAIESHGNARRIKVVGVSGWTGWTHCRLIDAAAPKAPPAPKRDTARKWEITESSLMIRRRQKCHALLREAAEGNMPCPGDPTLARLIGCTHRTAGRMIADLGEAKAFAIEHRSSNVRRVVFPDGKATDWTSTANMVPARSQQLLARPSGRVPTVKPPVVSSRARDAQLALQRMDIVVFDRWVVDGGAPGLSWCVDGRNVDAAGLIAIAEKRLGAVSPA